jgi:hypothetical protein
MANSLLKRFCNLIKLEVERKTDVIALTAFALSLTGIIYQVTGFFLGPEVTLISPRQLLIKSHEILDLDGNRQEYQTNQESRGKRYIAFVTSIAYVNSGRPGENAVILSENISFRLENRNYGFRWFQFGITKPEGSGFKFDIQRSANPFVVNAGGAESHETLFGPNTDKDYIEEGEFIEAMRRMLPKDQDIQNILPIKLHAQTANDGSKFSKCDMVISLNAMDDIKKTGWGVFDCALN